MTNLVLDAAKTVSRGFLLGIGFSVAFGIFAFAAERGSSQRAQDSYQESLTSRNPAKDVALANAEEMKRDGATVILGTATNNGKKSVRNFHIQANLFDHGKFVDQYSTFITGSLDPGKSQYFKITCGCKDTVPAEHDSFKLEVLGGY